MAKYVQYIRTDKNGTKIYHDYTCSRCGGAGGSEAWKYTGWTCYECGGTGITSKPQIIKEYTPEYAAKLDARRQKRAEKRQAEQFQKNVAGQADWLVKKGFVDGKIHVVIADDTFGIKDALKAAGGHFDPIVGWYFSGANADYTTVELTADECFEQNAWGSLDWKSFSDLEALIKSRAPKVPESEYIGNVGDKVELDVTHKRTRYYDTMFGTTWVHTFEDSAGNCLVWKTTSSQDFQDGEKYRVKGTIKAHDEYNGVKQTVLTRCKVA